MEKEKIVRRQEKMVQERYKSDRTAMEDCYEQSEMTPGKRCEAGGTTPGEEQESGSSVVSETWAEETIADLDDFIESQGIYIRQ